MRAPSVVLCCVGLLLFPFGRGAPSSVQGDEKGKRGGPWEFKVVSFAGDEKASEARLAELASEGWEYYGLLPKDRVAFRRSSKVGAAAKEVEKLRGAWGLYYYSGRHHLGGGGGGGNPTAPEPFLDGHSLTFKGTSYSVIGSDGKEVLHRGEIEVTDTLEPVKKIDFICKSKGFLDGVRYRGVYRITRGGKIEMLLDVGNNRRPKYLPVDEEGKLDVNAAMKLGRLFTAEKPK